MDEQDVGAFYTTNGEDVWQLVSYCASPTAIMLNIRTGDRVGGGIGCLNLQPFIKLIPEKEPNGHK